MARAIWAGAIGLGMVSIPVRLFPATRKRDVRFRELDRVTGQRIHHRRVRVDVPEYPDDAGWEPEVELRPRSLATPPPESPIPREVAVQDVVKGYEVSPGRFVTIERDEVIELQPERSRTIDVDLFVDSAAIDPIHYDAAYHAVPLLDHARPFAVLQAAMREEKRIALGWIVLRTRRHLAALRPFGEGLVLSTMYFADEILPAPGAGLAGPALTLREREMAQLLVRTLSGPFEPEQFRDEYRERLLGMIGERSGEAVEVPEPTGPTPSSVDDLLAALKASVEQAKAQKRESRKSREA